MTSATNEQLRTLVGNYYHGLVTFQSYREQRDSILDGLRKQAAPVVESAPRDVPVQKPANETQTKSVAPTPQQDAPLPAANPRSRVRWAALGGVAAAVAVAVAVAAWIAFQQTPEMPAVTERTESPTLGPGAALLEQFMQRNAWDQDAAQNLEVAWGSALTNEQRQEALSSPTYARFRDTLRGRLREEEALSGLEVSSELEALAGLADRFGVPYSRSPRRAGASSAIGNAVPASLVAAEAADEARARVAPAEEAGARREELAEPSPGASDAAPAPPIERAAANAETSTGSATVAADAPGASSAGLPAAASATPAGAACSPALLSTRRPLCSDPLRSGGTSPLLAIVPAGEFEMGGEQTNDEKPPHAVTIGKAFAMSVYEVSFAEFGAYCKAAGERCPENPWGSDAFPVALVSWDEAVAYARWLSSETGQSYRLPSEAEWEYAARAGSRTPYPFGDDVTPVAARSSANGPVDSPLANTDRSVNRNAFRLFHMIGNLREWVGDHWYSGYAGAPSDGTARLGAEANPRVVRGGSYSDGPLQLRSAARASLERGTRDRFTGFRVVRDLPP